MCPFTLTHATLRERHASGTPRFGNGKGTGREKGRPPVLASLPFQRRGVRDGKGRGNASLTHPPIARPAVFRPVFSAGKGRELVMLFFFGASSLHVFPSLSPSFFTGALQFAIFRRGRGKGKGRGKGARFKAFLACSRPLHFPCLLTFFLPPVFARDVFFSTGGERREKGEGREKGERGAKMTRGIGTDRRGDSVEGEKLTKINGLMIVAGVGATSPYASQSSHSESRFAWQERSLTHMGSTRRSRRKENSSI